MGTSQAIDGGGKSAQLWQCHCWRVCTSLRLQVPSPPEKLDIGRGHDGSSTWTEFMSAYEMAVHIHRMGNCSSLPVPHFIPPRLAMAAGGKSVQLWQCHCRRVCASLRLQVPSPREKLDIGSRGHEDHVGNNDPFYTFVRWSGSDLPFPCLFKQLVFFEVWDYRCRWLRNAPCRRTGAWFVEDPRWCQETRKSNLLSASCGSKVWELNVSIPIWLKFETFWNGSWSWSHSTALLGSSQLFQTQPWSQHLDLFRSNVLGGPGTPTQLQFQSRSLSWALGA